MIVSSTGCLQAVCNECEFVGNDCEQSACLVGHESERKDAMFASRGDYVCKLLHLLTESEPNKALHLTAYSVRSAPASGSR